MERKTMVELSQMKVGESFAGGQLFPGMTDDLLKWTVVDNQPGHVVVCGYFCGVVIGRFKAESAGQFFQLVEDKV